MKFQIVPYELKGWTDPNTGELTASCCAIKFPPQQLAYRYDILFEDPKDETAGFWRTVETDEPITVDRVAPLFEEHCSLLLSDKWQIQLIPWAEER